MVTRLTRLRTRFVKARARSLTIIIRFSPATNAYIVSNILVWKNNLHTMFLVKILFTFSALV